MMSKFRNKLLKRIKINMKDLKAYDCLKPCIGINLLVAKNKFSEHFNINTRGYNKEIGGVAEDVAALSFNLDRPTSKKGADFKKLGDCKSVKARMSNRGLNINQKIFLTEIGVDHNNKNCQSKIRNCGNPLIANFQKGVSYHDSNLYKKIRKVIFFYNLDNIVIDIRIFSGKKFNDTLQSDYDLIAAGRNSETKILTYKKKTGSIQIKKFLDIFLSKSIIDDGFKNEIDDQVEYINNHFSEKLTEYSKVPDKEYTLSEMEEYRIRLLNKIEKLDILINQKKESKISEQNAVFQSILETEYYNDLI